MNIESFSQFFMQGPSFDGGRYRRAEYPSDRLEAKEESSYDYSGKVTNTETQGNLKIVSIDNSVKYTTVRDETRKIAQEKFGSLNTAAKVSGYIGIAGLCLSIWGISEKNVVIGFTGILLSGVLSAGSFYRASDASHELKQWDDQTTSICKKRAAKSSNICALQKSKLSETHFTRSETQHIYHQTIDKLEREFTAILSSQDPTQIEKWIKKFMKSETPFSKSILNETFRNQNEIINPKEPQKGYWTKNDLIQLSDNFETIKQNYIRLQTENEGKLINIETANRREIEIIKATAVASRELLHLSENRNLRLHIQIRDEALANLEADKKNQKLTPEEYRRRKQKIEDEFNHNSDVKWIQAQSKSYDTLSRIGESLAYSVSSQHAKAEREKIELETNETVMSTYPDLISQIFNGYQTALKTREG